MKIQVLGPGCASCHKLHELTEKAVDELGLKEKVEYITDISKVIEMGVMSSPVLAINGKPVVAGFIPDIEKIKSLLTKGSNNSEVSNSAKGSGCSCGGNC